MKAKLFPDSSAVVLLITAGLFSTVNGRIQSHGHQHGDVLGRIMHKPTASSGSSVFVTAIDNSTGVLPTVTGTAIGIGCFGEDCGPLNATHLSEIPTRITPVPQVQFQPPELQAFNVTTASSRRRHRFRSTTASQGEASLSIERDSFSTGLPITKPAVIIPSGVSVLPTKPSAVFDGTLKEASAQDSLDRHSNSIVPRQDDGYQSFVLNGPSSVAVASVTAYGGTFTQESSSSTSAAASSPASSSSTSTSAAALSAISASSISSSVAGLSVTSTSSTSSSTAASSASASSVCPAGNGTTYTSAGGINYKIICNVDYADMDFPFQLVGSFADCVLKCDAWNYDNHQVECIAALFVPSRGEDANDCYLKSKLIDPSVASMQIEGAIRIGYATVSSSLPTASSSEAENRSSTSISASTLTASSSALSIVGSSSTSHTSSSSASTTTAPYPNSQSSTSSSTAATTTASKASSPGVTYASGTSVVVPKVAQSKLQGPSINTPTQQYLDIKAPAGITLSSSLLTVGVNGDLTTGYDVSLETGVLEVNISTQSYLSTLTNMPHLSRDGGRGGMVNGEHLFVFCDTGSYSTTSSISNGNFLGFTSSSVATDVGMKGLSGGALNLQDGIGEWSDNVGRMRGFAPLTEGEVAYNIVMQGQGQRYAVWPESDIIPLDATTGILYAPIVYDNVNENTKAAVFTYTGTTLLTITAGGKGGPVAERTVAKIFQQDEVEWGCAGGIRSWGPSGIGGDDGSVYIFGNVAGGILLGRTSPANVADANSIQYWNGNSWTNDMPTSSSTAYFIAGAFMDVNVFYSPRHLTFIIVYLTIYADSTFYYRYLEADQGILPPFAPGGDPSSDYVANILKYKWSGQQVLYKAAQGLSGKYIYSGGPHLGYYGSNDIINGGTKMSISWTAPTGLDPSTLTSEYQIPTAEIDWA